MFDFRKLSLYKEYLEEYDRPDNLLTDEEKEMVEKWKFSPTGGGEFISKG